MTEDQLLAAWQTNHRINVFLIEHIGDEGMRCTLSKRGGRDVARQFAHLSYFIAHESHHRGSILLTLKQCEHRLNNDKAYGIWAWDQI